MAAIVTDQHYIQAKDEAMLATGQMREDGKVKNVEAEHQLYRLGLGLVFLAALITAVVASLSGQVGWSIWLQLGVAAVVFAFMIGLNRLQLSARQWTLSAAGCAALVFMTSILTGPFLNVLLAPLIVGAGLRSHSLSNTIKLILGTSGLLLLEAVGFVVLNWKGLDSSPLQSTVSLIIAISTVGIAVGTFMGSFRKKVELLEKEHESNASEMVVAHEIQTSLMAPNEIETGNWSMAARSIPAKDVGGDFYEYIPYLDRGIGGIAIGDVAGKGIPAALQMAVVRTLFRVEARRRIFPAETLNSVNTALQAERSFGMVTMLYAFVDPATTTLHLANAGHNYPVILNGSLEEMKLPGLPLGIDDSIEYEEKVMKIKPGTSVVFYTDGVVEAMSADGEMYGFERMKKALMKNQALEPRLLVDKLMAEVAEFTGGAPQSDDITVVVLQHHPQAAEIDQPEEPDLDTGLIENDISPFPATVASTIGADDNEDDGINWI
jgi:serine phosphatase RsbU (regulator of sigma subunit)